MGAAAPRDRLRVPIGVGADGAAGRARPQGVGAGRHGPARPADRRHRLGQVRAAAHAGARRWPLTHSSETLNFVLVDFKGGATFLGLDRLPHTSAVITNLADELPWSTGCSDALHGELIRRQELLRAAGNYASLRDYEKARAAGAAARRRCPSLLVVVDEFSELLAAKPEFIDLFVDDRPARPLARRAPAAGLAAPRGGPAARAGDPPVLPDRAAHVLGDRSRGRARRAGRLRAAAACPARLPEDRHRARWSGFKAAYVSGPLPRSAGQPADQRGGSASRAAGARAPRTEVPPGSRAGRRRWSPSRSRRTDAAGGQRARRDGATG